MSPSKQGDQRRITELIVENRTAIFGFIMAQLTDAHAAEDVFQEVCLVICEKWESYNPSLPFRSWAFGIARNKVRQYFTKSKRSKTVLASPEFIDQLAKSPVWDEDCIDEKQALIECLKKLSQKIQNIFKLRYFQDLDLPAIAKEIGWNPRSVSVTMTRARTKLMKCIDTQISRQTR